ncbi:MAG: sigma-70 family RNA polymerase sigma factor [Saprospiraceae bacterium]|nr:sigma-70 family RNA polymerase sigma factor [Saprospiraceae bacterium]
MHSVGEMTDEDLISYIKQSADKKGFSVLFKRYAHLLLGWCLRYLKDQQSSEDAVMDIMEQLIQNLHRYEIENFKNWLFLVTRNHCYMRLRGQTHLLMDDLSQLDSEDFMEKQEDMHLQIEQKENDLHEAIEGLKGDQKRCIVLFYFKKKSYKEIAQATGFEEKKVKSHIQNGKRNLKLELEKSSFRH